MSQILIASISALCVSDHGNDPGALAAWTANKSPEGLAAMLADPEGSLFVAERDGIVLAVGAIRHSGEISLNYVAPWARFTGVSKALLRRLEDELARLGHDKGRLEATATALRFYAAAGWVTTGPQAEGRRVNGYPMVKVF